MALILKKQLFTQQFYTTNYVAYNYFETPFISKTVLQVSKRFLIIFLDLAHVMHKAIDKVCSIIK